MAQFLGDDDCYNCFVYKGLCNCIFLIGATVIRKSTTTSSQLKRYGEGNADSFPVQSNSGQSYKRGTVQGV